jgi:hypothetical protein
MKMKPAIAITTTILVSVLAAGLASAQSPRIIQNTRNTMNTVNSNATAASNAALGIHQPAPANATHAPAKSSGVRVATPLKPSSSPAGARSADAKRAEAKRRERDRARRGGAVLVEQSVQPAPIATPEENASADAVAAGHGASGSGGGENAESEQSVVPDTKSNANGRRDPFISPVVVSRAGGSGCSTGKKCLEIGTINLRGVVRAENGFIAVVSNSMNKAYFLRENDPVFNGYVMKITGDSIVFQETLQDRMGKTFTREVVKKITTPAV